MWLLIPTCWCPNFADTLFLVALLVYLSYIVAHDKEKSKQPGSIVVPNFILALIYLRKYGMQLEVEKSTLSFCESSFLCWLVPVVCTYFLSKKCWFSSE